MPTLTTERTGTTKQTNPTTLSLTKIDTWMQRLADETNQAAQSEELTRYLRTLAKFWTYSTHNCLLIAMQRPTATRVAGYRTWQAVGRQVKKGAKGIAILCPIPLRVKAEDGSEETDVVRFRTGYVFDIADTTGDALPDVSDRAVEGTRYDALLRRLVEIADRSGLSVTFHNRLAGDANGLSYGDGRIALKGSNPSGNLCKTLIHELAHERLHGALERRVFPRQQLECQAEAIAYCVCQALGIPTPNTPTYLALYRIGRDELAANLDAIRAGTVRLMEELAPVLDAPDRAA